MRIGGVAGLSGAGVWTTVRAGNQPAGSFGESVAVNLDATVTSRLGNITALPPSLYPAAGVASSVTADAFGSWTLIFSNVGVSRVLTYVLVAPGAGLSLDWEIEIGTGASGSETAVYRFNGGLRIRSDAGINPIVVMPVHLALADNARVAARARDSDPAAQTYRIGIQVR